MRLLTIGSGCVLLGFFLGFFVSMGIAPLAKLPAPFELTPNSPTSPDTTLRADNDESQPTAETNNVSISPRPATSHGTNTSSSTQAPQFTKTTFGTPTLYTRQEKQILPDGLTVLLTEITDSRCKPDVQCIWAGELAPQLLVTGGDFAAAEIKITLGTSRTQALTQGSYSFILTKASETTATITIIKTVTTAKATTPVAPAARVAGATASLKQNVAVNTFNPSTFASEVANLITAATTKFRVEESLPAFRKDTALTASAKKYSSGLLAGNYLAHIDTRGCDLTCRFSESGYKAQSWGENLAMMEYGDQPSAQYVSNYFMTKWLKSAGHRQNILSNTFTNQGIGVSVEEGKIYVTVHFALPE